MKAPPGRGTWSTAGSGAFHTVHETFTGALQSGQGLDVRRLPTGIDVA